MRIDNDLGLKFKRGEVAPNDIGEINVAIALNVGGENIDLILFDRGEAREVLAQVREAAEQALEGLKGAPLTVSYLTPNRHTRMRPAAAPCISPSARGGPTLGQGMLVLSSQPLPP